MQHPVATGPCSSGSDFLCILIEAATPALSTRSRCCNSADVAGHGLFYALIAAFNGIRQKLVNQQINVILSTPFLICWYFFLIQYSAGHLQAGQMQIQIPTVTTERLALVPPDPAHLADYLLAYGDTQVMKHIDGPMDAAKVWQMLATQIGHWVLRGFGVWSVQLRESGAIIGRLGLRREEGASEIEIGWVLTRDSWGKGYATEGARAAIDFGFECVGAEQIHAYIAPENTGSIDVATKLGMLLDPVRSTPEASIYVLARSAEAVQQPVFDAKVVQ